MNIKNTENETQHDWPEGTFIQGRQYTIQMKYGRQAFVEAFPGDYYLRADADTVAEAETMAWEQYQRYEACPGHEYERRNYRNGVGFCVHCGRFKSHVFEPLERCATCNVATYHSEVDGLWYCEEHAPPNPLLASLEEGIDEVTVETIAEVLDAISRRCKDDAA